MCKMKISVKYAENFLMFDLLLTSGFKIQSIPILACHVESVYPKCHFVFLINWKAKFKILYLDFAFASIKKDEIQIIDYHFHV